MRLINLLFIVLHLMQEFFSYIETSLMPISLCKIYLTTKMEAPCHSKCALKNALSGELEILLIHSDLQCMYTLHSEICPRFEWGVPKGWGSLTLVVWIIQESGVLYHQVVLWWGVAYNGVSGKTRETWIQACNRKKPHLLSLLSDHKINVTEPENTHKMEWCTVI